MPPSRRFLAWWRRAVRAGHAYAELFLTHRHWGHEVASIVLYGLALPIVAFGLAPVTFGASLALFAAYVWLYLRVRAHRIRKGGPRASRSPLRALLRHRQVPPRRRNGSLPGETVGRRRTGDHRVQDLLRTGGRFPRAVTNLGEADPGTLAYLALILWVPLTSDAFS